ncbi:predicted protein [Thalassiosira pseudonana CCMP1335]|uniref:DNA-directed RNA polymerase III subunit n=1 Tax=Thalassiosira pseudonana TaxID=35128 RepID=B5YNS2_THAPS|nr:predicted protein [Thalassiosira pseudonana CCMP1335]ACI65035.1 predicted protein [Thalassiosira pseudonana CCMP1335]
MSGRGRGRGRGRGAGPQSISQQFLLRSAQEAGFDVRNLRALGATSGLGIFPDLELHSSGERRLHDGEGASSGDVPVEVGGGGVAVKSEDGASVSAQPATCTSNPSAASSSNNNEEEATKRTPQQIYLISKARELHHRFQTSVFYVRTTKEVPDVTRYSDRLLPPPNIDASAVLSHCLGGRKRTQAGVFVPEELCGGQKRRVRTSSTAGVDGDSSNKRGLNLEELAKKIQTDGVDGGNNANDGEEEKQGEGEEAEYYSEEGEESDGEDYVQNYYESEGDESKGSDGEPTF